MVASKDKGNAQAKFDISFMSVINNQVGYEK